MRKILLMLFFLCSVVYADLDTAEIAQAERMIKQYSDFDLSKNLDEMHATWLCIIYYNKHSKLSGAAGDAVLKDGNWQCPILVGYSGKKASSFIYVNSKTLIVSRKGWPTEKGQALLSQIISELKQEITKSAVYK